MYSSPQRTPFTTLFANLKNQRFPTPPPKALTTSLHTSTLKPPAQVLTLTDIEFLKDSTAFDNSFHAYARDTNTATDGEFFEFEEMETDGAEGGVGDGGTAEG
jgi:hypothetical protein